MGEISGMAYIDREKELRGIGRILIKIYKETVVSCLETLSEYDIYI
jgi:hypothetical protein